MYILGCPNDWGNYFPTYYIFKLLILTLHPFVSLKNKKVKRNLLKVHILRLEHLVSELEIFHPIANNC